MKKILIANRGEIAVRIIRACHELGLQTVAVHSEADSEALHVLHADEAVCIGKAPCRSSYLKMSSILSACEITGADAVHPGYGFLSENGRFAAICKTCGLNFIGPSSEHILELGDKARAKALAKKVRCPVIPGSEGVVASVEEALDIACQIGFPIFIKAALGGGGRGIRIARSREELPSQFAAAQAEASLSFGSDAVYLEKVLQNPRHVEVQILGDRFGNIIHLGERDCSLQRRRQKLIEEAPSLHLTPRVRKKMCKAALSLVKSVGYHSLGTVEFLLDASGQFYFMEVNPRIQVEHTITEMITGVDLVKEQIRVALGEKLQLRQKDVSFSGHAMQFRINAEDPVNHFSPCPGVLEYYLPSGGPHVRVDSACYSGCVISPYYDSLIAKLIVRGSTREEAIFAGKRALREFHVGGVPTTISFHQKMLEDSCFLTGEHDISYVDRMEISRMQN